MELLVQLSQFKILKDTLLQLKDHDLHLIHLLDTMIHLPQEEASHYIRQKAIEETRQKIRSRMQYAWKALEYFDKLTGRTNVFSEQLYQSLLANATRPFSDCIQGLPRLVHSLSETLGKHINLDIQGKDIVVDRHLVDGIDKCLNHIVRNACDHGIERPEERTAKAKRGIGSIQVKAYHHAGFLILEVKDDGRGIAIASLRNRVVELGLVDEALAKKISKNKLLDYIFLPGVSTAKEVSEVSGRGVGLDVVRDFLEQEQGSIHIRTEVNQGTAFVLQLPIMRSVLKTILTRIGVGLYAFHKESIEAVLSLSLEYIQEKKGNYYYQQDNSSIPLVHLGDLLKIPYRKLEEGLKIILLRSEKTVFGLIVDTVEGEAPLLVKPLHPRLGKIACVSSSSFNEGGEPIFILDTSDILDILRQRFSKKTKQYRASSTTYPKLSFKTKALLWVDDSAMIRDTVAPKIFSSSAYKLMTAKDGTEALAILQKKTIDLLITDLDMPHMTGETLIQRVRSHPGIASLPVLIVSSKNKEDHPVLDKEYFVSKNRIMEEEFLKFIDKLL